MIYGGYVPPVLSAQMTPAARERDEINRIKRADPLNYNPRTLEYYTEEDRARNFTDFGQPYAPGYVQQPALTAPTYYDPDPLGNRGLTAQDVDLSPQYKPTHIAGVPMSEGDLSLDEMMYDPSQPNRLYTFEDGKRMVEKLGLINRTDAEIQQAVDILNSRYSQQTTTPTTPALDPTTATADPNTGALTTVDPNTATANPVSQPMLNTQNEQRLQAMFDSMNAEKEGKQGLTGNARESTSTFHKLAMTGMGEKLMRMGAAMNANAHLGGNAMLGAMGQQQAAYNADRLAAQQFEQEQRANALSAYNASIAEQQDALNVVDDTLRGYENALADFDRFSSVTGFIDGTFTQMLDNAGLGNDARQAFRLRLKQIAVDTTLLNTAKTKGAISDREMALFQSPVPSMYATEGVWRKWLESRIESTKIIRRRIAQGITVARDADSTLNLYDYTADTDAQNAAQKAQMTAQGNQNMSPAPQAQQTNQIELTADELADIEANLSK